MNGEDEQMFQGRETHELRAHEGTGPKIKRTFRLLPHQMGGKISGAGPWEITRVERWQIQRQTRSDQLIELASLAFESRAERLVPGDDFVQRSTEHSLIERAAPAERERHVERGIAARLHLIEQPKASLGGSRGKNEDAGRVRGSGVALSVRSRSTQAFGRCDEIAGSSVNRDNSWAAHAARLAIDRNN